MCEICPGLIGGKVAVLAYGEANAFPGTANNVLGKVHQFEIGCDLQTKANQLRVSINSWRVSF